MARELGPSLVGTVVVPSPPLGKAVLGPSVDSAVAGFVGAGFTLLPAANFEPVFDGPVALPAGPLDSGLLAFAVDFNCSCLFFSRAFLFSAIASAFSFSLARFSSSFFLRSTSISLADLGMALGLPGSPGFLAALPPLVVAILLVLVAALVPAEAGFFVSG